MTAGHRTTSWDSLVTTNEQSLPFHSESYKHNCIYMPDGPQIVPQQLRTENPPERAKNQIQTAILACCFKCVFKRHQMICHGFCDYHQPAMNRIHIHRFVNHSSNYVVQKMASYHCASKCIFFDGFWMLAIDSSFGSTLKHFKD